MKSSEIIKDFISYYGWVILLVLIAIGLIIFVFNPSMQRATGTGADSVELNLSDYEVSPEKECSVECDNKTSTVNCFSSELEMSIIVYFNDSVLSTAICDVLKLEFLS